MKPKISVIIPVYNAESYISECMESVMNQTLKDIEIICVNDGSEDNSSELVLACKEKDSRVVLVNQEKMGAAHARNNAMKIATGQFVAFIDSDDYYPENDILEILYRTAVNESTEIVLGSLALLRIDGKIINNHVGVYSGFSFDEDKLINYSDYQFDYGFTRGIYKLDMLRQNDIYFPIYERFQDPPFFCKALLCAGKFYALKKTTYLYRRTEKSLNLWSERKVIDSILGVMELLKLSTQHGFDKLHLYCFHRLTIEINSHTKIWLKKGNRKIFALLAEANGSIDTSLLLKAKNSVDAKSWEHMKNFCQDDMILIDSLRGIAQKPTRLNSIKGGFQCLKDHGFIYTFKHICKKFSKNKGAILNGCLF